MKLGLLTSIAIGDAFGRPFEFEDKEKRINKFSKNKYALYDLFNNYDHSGVGKYTDDTQMSIAISNHMLRNYSISQISFANSFLDTYNNDKRDGYSYRIKQILDTSKSGIDLIARISDLKPKPTNGSMMRCIPLGLYKDVNHIMHCALVQSITTHQHIDSILAAQVIALTAHYFYYGINSNVTSKIEYFSKYEKWITDIIGDEFFLKLKKSFNYKEVSTNALETAYCCILNVMRNNSYSEIIEKSIIIGGDVDTVLAVSLGLAYLKGINNDLPDELIENLENGKYGKDYLMGLDYELEKKFTR